MCRTRFWLMLILLTRRFFNIPKLILPIPGTNFSQTIQIWIPVYSLSLMNLFLVSYNLVKNSNSPKSIYGSRYHPLRHLSFKFYVRIQVMEDISLYQRRPFLAQGNIMKCFGPFVPGSI